MYTLCVCLVLAQRLLKAEWDHCIRWSFWGRAPSCTPSSSSFCFYHTGKKTYRLSFKGTQCLPKPFLHHWGHHPRYTSCKRHSIAWLFACSFIITHLWMGMDWDWKLEKALLLLCLSDHCRPSLHHCCFVSPILIYIIVTPSFPCIKTKIS